jgi:hypothetical protein
VPDLKEVQKFVGCKVEFFQSVSKHHEKATKNN